MHFSIILLSVYFIGQIKEKQAYLSTNPLASIMYHEQHLEASNNQNLLHGISLALHCYAAVA
jgi:hypothetical protein